MRPTQFPTASNPPLRLIRSADQLPMPWKNGGGVTTEIAASPQGSSLDTFGWRVSRAQVAAAGPFSVFPGIDRTLAILEGVGLVLTVEDEPPVRLSSQSPPFAFAADKPAHASLVDGPIADLNIMSRRGQWRHSVERVGLSTASLITLDATEWLIYCETGSLRVSADGHTAELKQYDAVAGMSAQANIEPIGLTSVYVIAFHRI